MEAFGKIFDELKHIIEILPTPQYASGYEQLKEEGADGELFERLANQIKKDVAEEISILKGIGVKKIRGVPLQGYYEDLLRYFLEYIESGGLNENTHWHPLLYRFDSNMLDPENTIPPSISRKTLISLLDSEEIYYGE